MVNIWGKISNEANIHTASTQTHKKVQGTLNHKLKGTKQSVLDEICFRGPKTNRAKINPGISLVIVMVQNSITGIWGAFLLVKPVIPKLDFTNRGFANPTRICRLGYKTQLELDKSLLNLRAFDRQIDTKKCISFSSTKSPFSSLRK
jgi:hypothetical protein